jgi:hypothetical protein
MMSGGNADEIRTGAEGRVKRGKQQAFEADTDRMMRDIDTEDIPSPIHPDIQKKYQYYDGGTVNPVDEADNSTGTVSENVPVGWYPKSGAKLPDMEELQKPMSRVQSFQEGPTGEYTAYNSEQS